MFAHRLFEAWAARAPDCIAVDDGRRRLSYAELNRRANQLTRHLQACGTEAETLIGISLPRSVELAVAILAVLKAGAAYLPLDPSYPAERLSFMRADARPKFLITRKGIAIEEAERDLQRIEIDRHWQPLANESRDNPEIAIEPHDLAYVIYTSGSTGKPKGVEVTHGNLGHYVQSLRQSVNVSERDVSLHTASISFSSSVRQLMFPLSLGAQVVIAAPDYIENPLVLFELIKKCGVTVIDLVPSYWRACTQALAELSVWERERLLDNNLRLILSASEPLYSENVRDWRALGHKAQLVNMFGQTETTGIVLTCPIRDREAASKIVPLGRPIADTEVYVLDDRLQPVADGETGELYIGGRGVGRGYLNHPKLTAEKFIPDPSGNDPQARLYNTGDLARIGADGNVEFLGRIDNQVKIRGHRIEPGEIEAVLREHPSVRDCVVVPSTDNHDARRLIAYVVPEDRNAPAISGRERYRLPNGMAIVHQNQHESDFFYQQIFVDQTNFRHGITLNEGDCVFDVGANIGMFTLFANQSQPRVTIFAFEPIPEIFNALEINAALYGNSAKLFNCGLAEREQTTEFVFYPNSTSQSGRYADADDERQVLRSIIENMKAPASASPSDEMLDEVVKQRVRGERVTCKLKTLSQVIREQGVKRIDLLKIDVEKSELDVLAGIEENDWPKIRQVVIEAHDQNGQLTKLTALLRGHGFEVIAEQDRYLHGSSLYNVYASRSPLTVNGDSGGAPFILPEVTETCLSSSELREHLQQRLPDYYWPSTFVILEKLPRLPNGKIDRQALPEPQRELEEDSAQFVPARTPIEETLTRIWAEVLKFDRISAHDNFFDLGGDSILSAQIIAKASKAGLKLTPRQLFQHQTIAELAEVASSANGSAAPNARAALEIFNRLNRTAVDYPRDSCIHELFEQQVAGTPEAIAVHDAETTLTFRELNERANRLARRLRALGVGPETLVGIHLERSPELIVAVLGTLKAGGAYVPLDPTYPSELLSFMLADSQATVLLTQQEIARVIDAKARIICLDDPSLNLYRESPENIVSGATAGNLAYVIYTSGSTGKPKGVMIPHRALVNYACWAVREYDLANGNGAPLHSSIAFDLTITSLFCPLLAGRPVTLPRATGGIDALSEALVEGRTFSLVKITPTHLRALNNLLPKDSLAGRTKVLVVGGEALRAEMLANWRRAAPATRIINEYGPTEATVGCCVYEVKAGDPDVGDIPIGRLIANAQIYILDQDRQPVAEGEIGEIYIGGDGLARGYLNRPDLTEELFIRNPFSSDPEARVYRSGDLARLRSDGNIEFLGRADNQVKIRGYRVELAEIESVLLDHAGIREAVVGFCEDETGNGRLIAYVAPKTSGAEQELTAELRGFLKARLPAYMLPASFEIREALPVTANGKIDRGALEKSMKTIAGSGAGAARSPVEATLTKIWAEVLRLDRVGIYDNFFDLGGDSILGAQILARAARAGLSLTPKQLFERQTIAELSPLLKNRNGKSSVSTRG